MDMDMDMEQLLECIRSHAPLDALARLLLASVGAAVHARTSARDACVGESSSMIKRHVRLHAHKVRRGGAVPS